IMNSHNAKLPVWMLTPMEEKEARKRWKEYAYKQCDEVVQKFAKCSKENGVGVLWNCRSARDDMNKCILRLQKPEELDRQRELLIAEKIEK
ncbi:hypothetical protein WICANDRAFT_17719, partial [Wickerhamomyces anomalus NRRL Y-366-8]